MISMIVPIAAGNALRVFLVPPATARLWRLLRKGSDTFVDQNDPAAVVVYEGNQRPVLDYTGLANGTTYYYRAYYWDGSAWSASATVSATPVADYEDASADPLTLLRDRIDAGIQVELARGTLVHENGAIRVLTAPPVYEDTIWPVITVQLQSDAPSQRGLGEMVEADSFDDVDGDWIGSEGWLSRVQIVVVGWSQNPDERIALRQALRRIIVANLPVFDEAGLLLVEFSQQDMEDFKSYPAPVYQTMGTFNCVAPVRVVSSRDPAIADVQTTIIEG